MRIEPVTLEGRHARLEPLAPHHAEGLCAAGSDPSVWAYLPMVRPAHVEDFRALIDAACVARGKGHELPFAIIRRIDNRIAGTTRYLDIQRQNRSLEIGWTWLGAEFQRTPINTECKYLLMTHAFEQLGAVRVFFKTDSRNLRSQAALERIGAKREGTLRKHMILPDGYQRDSVYFSVIDNEWADVKARLETMMEGYTAGAKVTS
jgi:RimJ/RimL family protein N-acetyltransferase